MIQIRTACATDIDEIMPHIRQQDIDEIIAATGGCVKDELKKAIKRSGSKYTAYIQNGPLIAIYGVADTSCPSKIGSPWLVGTDYIKEHSKAFLKCSKAQFPALIKDYDYLVNMVDTRNRLSRKWLSWLGFRIHAPRPYGPEEQLFHKFDMCRIAPMPDDISNS